jgi:predicted ribosomally synthesized peptide with SipW-like signal peptide
MTHDLHGISRRSVLAALGAVGVTASGSGVATYAYLADREQLGASLAAGRVDLRADYRTTRGDETVHAVPESVPRDADCTTPDLIDGDVLPDLTFANVVPGESGTLSSCVYVCGNPTYLWLRACVTDDEELVYTDREAAAGDTTSTAGELAGALRATLYLDENGDGVRDPAEPVVFEGSLADLDAFACAGTPLGPPPESTTNPTNDGPGEYEGTPVPLVPEDACVGMGKLNVVDDRWFVGDEEPGNDMGFGDSIFTGVEYDETVDRFVFTTDAGETVLVRIDQLEFNDDDEVVAARVTVDSPAVGFCQINVKTGGGNNDSFANKRYDYEDCPRSVRVETHVDRKAISHITLFVCHRDDPEPPDPVCYEPGRYCLGVEWELPLDTGVEASTDTVTLDLAVAGSQCRHEMDPAARNPFDRPGAAASGASP